MKKIFFTEIFFIVFSVMLTFCQNEAPRLKSAKSGRGIKNFALFENDSLLEVALQFDLKTYYKKEFKEPLDAIMTFRLSATDSLTMNVKIYNHGTVRSTNCNYPPLGIYLKKTINAYSDFGRIEELKLFTSCDQGALYNEYVLREFLVYKLFNVLTDTSYRVRLLKLSFIDSRKRINPVRQYGFFLEPKEILAERINSAVIKSTNVSQKQIMPEMMDRLAIFNYMVGNYDWSVNGQHNITILKPLINGTSEHYIAIPHDFDGTGVVNPEYEIPTVEKGIKSVRDRIFLGPCRNKEIYKEDLKKILVKKEAIYNVINAFPYLDHKSKRDINDFINQFLNQIGEHDSLDNLIAIFHKSCKNHKNR